MVERRLAASLSPYPRRVFRYTHETRHAASLQEGFSRFGREFCPLMPLSSATEVTFARISYLMR